MYKTIQTYRKKPLTRLKTATVGDNTSRHYNLFFVFFLFFPKSKHNEINVNRTRLDE